MSAVIQDLEKKYGLGKAQKLLFTGSSAGAEGLLVQADRVKDMLPNVDVKILVDSGWFLDFAPLRPQPCRELFSCTEQEALQKGIKIWNPQVDVDCGKYYTGNSIWKCILGYHAYPFIQAPSFIMVFR